MNAMPTWGRLLGTTLTLCLLAGQVAAPQSLGEVAKKERERRARLGKDRPSEVIGENELENARGESLSVSGSEPRKPDAGTVLTAEERRQENEDRLSEKEIRDLRQEWSRIWKEQMDEARRQLEKARDDVYQCRSASYFVFVPMAIDCDNAPLALAVAEARLKEVESNRYHWETLLPGNSASR